MLLFYVLLFFFGMISLLLQRQCTLLILGTSCAQNGTGSIILAIQKTILIVVMVPSMFSLHFILTVGIK